MMISLGGVNEKSPDQIGHFLDGEYGTSRKEYRGGGKRS